MKSPIILVIILAVVGLGVFVFYNNSTSTKQSQQTSKNIAGLDKVDGSNYLFYYPKGYVTSDKDMGKEKVLYYVAESKKDTKEGISLNTYPVRTRMETPTSEFCTEFLKFSLSNPNVLRIIEAKPVDFIKSHGCDFMYVDDNVPGKLAAHEKHLWYKEGEDLNIYGSNARYLLTSPQAEIDALDLAVNSFILK